MASSSTSTLNLPSGFFLKVTPILPSKKKNLRYVSSSLHTIAKANLVRYVSSSLHTIAKANLMRYVSSSLHPIAKANLVRYVSSSLHPIANANLMRYVSSSLHTNAKANLMRYVSSSVNAQTHFSTVGAESTGPIPSDQLLQVVQTAANTGAEVIMDAVNKPRNITYKGLTDLVTDTDKMSEAAILDVVRKNFRDHLILGEEGGLIGDSSSDYLWCIDPLDGTTNFAHCYPSFAVSIGVLFKGKPAAATVVEFVGGPKCWNTRTFSAAAGKGAFCNGEKIHVSPTDKVERSLLVTGFGYEHDDAWATNIELFKEFTDISRGVRRLGAAAVDMCHVSLGIVEAYWEYRLKPWDMAAGVLIVEEAGGTVSCMDGGKFCVFDRSVLVSNGVLHAKLLEKIGPATENLKGKGIDFSLWYKPENYHTEL